MSQAMIPQSAAYASISNAQAMRPTPVGGFARKMNPNQVLLSSSPLEVRNAKMERKNIVCQATAAPDVSSSPQILPK